MEEAYKELVRKLESIEGETFEASNGVSIMLGIDGRQLWFTVKDERIVTGVEIATAVTELRAK